MSSGPTIHGTAERSPLLGRPDQRTLIFGGTFDPPHLAHTSLAARAASHLLCTRILVIPAQGNPQRDAPHAPAADRLRLTQIAFAAEPRAHVLDIEVNQARPSFTVDTLEQLRRQGIVTAGPVARPAAEGATFLLIGADQALNFKSWHRWRAIIDGFATPAVLPRKGVDLSAALCALHGPSEGALWTSWVLPFAEVDLSSTAARGALLRGGDASSQLDESVLDEIRRAGLYR